MNFFGGKSEKPYVSSDLDLKIPPPPSGNTLASPEPPKGFKPANIDSSTTEFKGFTAPPPSVYNEAGSPPARVSSANYSLPKFARKTGDYSSENHNNYLRHVATDAETTKTGTDYVSTAKSAYQLGAVLGGGCGVLAGLFYAVAYKKPSYLITLPAMGTVGVGSFIFVGNLLREL